MTAEPRCAICLGPPRDDLRIECADCGRFVGECAACGWFVRFFESDDPADCEGCGYRPPTPEEEERRRPERERLEAAFARQFDVLRQMVERSGPVYEIAKERSRIISEAYRAAGQPRDVTAMHGRDGITYAHWITRGPRKGQQEPATEAEWRAWRAWCAERERLRQRLRAGAGDR